MPCCFPEDESDAAHDQRERLRILRERMTNALRKGYVGTASAIADDILAMHGHHRTDALP